jgi:hypothetical protein
MCQARPAPMLASMKRIALILTSLAVVAAGCGGSDSDSSKPATADSFLACFKQDGYTAAKPAKGQESALAALARTRGFDNEPVNIAPRGQELAPSLYLIFFESADAATKARAELKANSLGEVPIGQKGGIVLGWTDRDEKSKLEAAVAGCI